MAIVTIPKGSVNWDVPVNENFADLDSRMPSKLNLLDNWYFVDPIDQRNGYIVPPDTPYYSDTALTTQAGTVSAYTTANYVNTTYGGITVSGTTYYVAYADMVRGYTSSRYGIDRWWGNLANITLADNGITVVNTHDTYGSSIRQAIENPKRFIGKQMTLSCLTSSVNGEHTINMVKSSGLNAGMATISFTKTKNAGLSYVTFTVPDDVESATYPMMMASFSISKGGSMGIIAAKLELGDKQTLAHQDANGNWVLNDPPPNKALELLKCQRYLVPLERWYRTRAVEITANMLRFWIDIPTTLRATPALIGFENAVIRDTGISKTYEDFTFAYDGISPEGVQIVANKTGHGMDDGVLVFSKGRAFLNSEL